MEGWDNEKESAKESEKKNSWQEGEKPENHAKNIRCFFKMKTWLMVSDVQMCHTK